MFGMMTADINNIMDNGLVQAEAEIPPGITLYDVFIM